MDWLFGAVAGMLLVGFYTVQQRIRVLENRLIRTQKLLRAVADKLGLPEDALEVELRRLVANRQRIQAIQRVREARGLSLRDAKELVDSL